MHLWRGFCGRARMGMADPELSFRASVDAFRRLARVFPEAMKDESPLDTRAAGGGEYERDCQIDACGGTGRRAPPNRAGSARADLDTWRDSVHGRRGRDGAG